MSLPLHVVLSQPLHVFALHVFVTSARKTATDFSLEETPKKHALNTHIRVPKHDGDERYFEDIRIPCHLDIFIRMHMRAPMFFLWKHIPNVEIFEHPCV